MLVKVKNRSNGISVYTIPELGDKRNVRRQFAPQETKEIEIDELRALTYIPGGTYLMEQYLQIMDPQALKELGLFTDIEYNMSKEDVIELMQRGSMDSFLDCLDFAPSGVINMIKDLSVTLPLNDSAKREAIKTKLGFDVDKALLHLREAKEDDAIVSGRERRVKPADTDNGSRRSVPTYNVVSK